MDWRQDKDYLDYIDSGESAAVYIVKNIVKSLDTKNMWVDVVSINTYYKRGSGNIAFKLDRCGVVSAENKTKV